MPDPTNKEFFNLDLLWLAVRNFWTNQSAQNQGSIINTAVFLYRLESFLAWPNANSILPVSVC